MAHGKALELRGIRSRVATSHWTRRWDTSRLDLFGVATRQNIRTGIMSGGTSEDRSARLWMATPREARQAIIGSLPCPRPDLCAWRISPKSRARLRYEARRRHRR